MERPKWYQLAASKAISTLGVDPGAGLSAAEASRRIEQYGPNVLREHRGPGPVAIFLSQFNDFLVWVLVAAVIVSIFVLNELLDGIAILVIVALNAMLGFVQEYRAENALAALRRLAAPKATVLRDGSPIELESRDLVPGDVILIATGDHIPADARLIETAGLRIDEASLTGESGGISKHMDPIEASSLALGDQKNMVFAGTVAVAGRGRAVVVATGQETQMGQVAEMIQVEDVKTPLQVELKDVGMKIGMLALAVCALVFAAGVLRGNPPVLMFLIAVSLAVAAIPEGLPAIVTISLALGVQLMARHNAIVRKLHAVETLGATSIICTDKTGTLTRNQMSVVRLFAGGRVFDVEGEQPDLAGAPADAVRWSGLVAALCNDATRGADGTLIGDPTETALVAAADKLGLETESAERLHEVAFDSERKRMSTVNRLGDGVWVLAKGAPEAILPRCDRLIDESGQRQMSPSDREDLLASAAELAEDGYRTLALAFRRVDESDARASADELEKGLVLASLIGMVDPPRPEVADAIDACRSARIRVAMVTGDHLLTAKTIASRIGLGHGRAVSGADLDAMGDDELAAAVDEITVYARVDPSHKMRIVNALQKKGAVVAMTGDGVNDAPALKRADIGVAMGDIGTDVTREASDMVLADDNFATIVRAVREGRMIFDNIRKSILFLLSCNVSEVLIMLVAMVFVSKPALLPLQILWINLITDGMPALALGSDPPSSQLMKRSPRSAAERILAATRLRQIAWQGALITAGGIAAFLGGLALGNDFPRAQTMVFFTMVATQLLHSLDFRSDHRSVFSAASLKNRPLLAAIAGSLALQLIVIYAGPAQRIFGTVGLGLPELGVVASASVAPVAIIDTIKVLLARRNALT